MLDLSLRKQLRYQSGELFGYWDNTLYLDDAIQSGWIVIFDLVSLGENKNKPSI